MVLWKQAQRFSLFIPVGALLMVAPAACASHPVKGEPSITSTGPQKKSVTVKVDESGNIESVRPYRVLVKRADKVEWVVSQGFTLEIQFKSVAVKATCPSEKCEVTVDLAPGCVYEYSITVFRDRAKKDKLDPELEVEP